MKKILFLLILLAGMSQAQVTVAPFTNARVTFLNGSGAPCSGCQLDTFAAGTTSALATYSDLGVTPNSNPIILGSDGSAVIYMQSASYKFRLRGSVASGGAMIWTQDNVTWLTPLTSFTQGTVAGNFDITQPTAATSGANQSSFNNCIHGTYWTGSASGDDKWCLNNTIGTGSNPTSTLTWTHSGSSGLATFSIPAANISFGGTTALNGDTTVAVGKVLKFSTDTGLSRDPAGGVDVGNGTQGDKSGSLNLSALTASGITNFTGSTGIPAATGTTLWMGGNFGSPHLGRIFVGDGTGWQLDFSKRTGSVTTDLFSMLDSGVFKVATLNNGTNLGVPTTGSNLVSDSATQTLSGKTLTSPVINTPSFSALCNNNNTGCKAQRFGATCTTGTTAGNTCTTAYTWTSAFADSSYTPVCIGVTVAQSGILTIESITASGFTARVTLAATAGSGASFAGVDCIAIHD